MLLVRDALGLGWVANKRVGRMSLETKHVVERGGRLRGPESP